MKMKARPEIRGKHIGSLSHFQSTRPRARFRHYHIMDAAQHHRPDSLSLFITSVWRDAQALVIIFKK
jgi:hypothetical protein